MLLIAQSLLFVHTVTTVKEDTFKKKSLIRLHNFCFSNIESFAIFSEGEGILQSENSISGCFRARPNSKEQ